ncbi:hypothetical protein [Longimicrobium sp.]|uniref:hypothetical protein n=1 Tax=Longimicrobium sp. TaxID=2029185 RepID=UPI003B3B4389
MRNLDLDALAVDSFSTEAAGDPTQWTAVAPPPTPGTITCYEAGVDACTVVQPCCVVKP